MSFDPLVANPGRLKILTALASGGPLEFVSLRHSTKLTDGNLATHARRLSGAGLIAIQKEFREGKPVTRFTLRAEGRAALECHARELLDAIEVRPKAVDSGEIEIPAAICGDDDWVD